MDSVCYPGEDKQRNPEGMGGLERQKSIGFTKRQRKKDREGREEKKNTCSL